MSRERDAEHDADPRVPRLRFTVTVEPPWPERGPVAESAEFPLESVLRGLRLTDTHAPFVARVGRFRIEVRLRGLGESP